MWRQHIEKGESWFVRRYFSHTPGGQPATRGKRSQSAPPPPPTSYLPRIGRPWRIAVVLRRYIRYRGQQYLVNVYTAEKHTKNDEQKKNRAGNRLTQSKVSSDNTAVVKTKSVYWIAAANSLSLLSSPLSSYKTQLVGFRTMIGRFLGRTYDERTGDYSGQINQ